jgi:hypothetical protein
MATTKKTTKKTAAQKKHEELGKLNKPTVSFEGAEMMSGTGGQTDYLVIYKGDTLKIGLKAVFEGDGFIPAVAIGIRVRAASVGGTVEQMDVGKAAVAQFQFLPFKKIKKDYASLFIGTMFPVAAFSSPEEMLSTVKENGYFDKLFEVFDKTVEGSDIPFLFPVDALHDYVYASIEKKVNDLMDKMSKADSKKENDEPADAVNFSPKLH